MKTDWNKTGRIIFSAGIFLWTLSFIFKDLLHIAPLPAKIFFYSGITIEVIGFFIIARNGGFKNIAGSDVNEILVFWL